MSRKSHAVDDPCRSAGPHPTMSARTPFVHSVLPARRLRGRWHWRTDKIATNGCKTVSFQQRSEPRPNANGAERFLLCSQCDDRINFRRPPRRSETGEQSDSR